MKEKIFSRLHKANGFYKVICFLCLEMLAVTAFNLTNTALFFGILGGIITILFFLTTVGFFNKDDYINIAIIVFPLVIFGLLTAVSYFNYEPSFKFANPATRWMIPFSMIFFTICGYMFGSKKAFNLQKILLVVYGAIAILTLINLCVTLVQFKPFYTITYRNKYLYFDGLPSQTSIGNMAYALMGFSFEEVTIEYFSMYPSILLTSSMALFFIKYKENKKLFLTFVGFTVLALITLILTPSIITLMLDAIVLITLAFVILTVKGIFKKSFLKIFFIVAGILGAIFFVILFLNAQREAGWGYVLQITGLQNFIRGNPFLNKIFNNSSLVAHFNSALDGLLSCYKFFGQPFEAGGYNIRQNWPLGVAPTGSIIIDTFMTAGFVGFVAFAIMVYLLIRNIIKFFKYSTEGTEYKTALIAFMFVFLTYGLLGFSTKPMVFVNESIPLQISSIFFVFLFLYGYIYKCSEKPKVIELKANLHEEKEEEGNEKVSETNI